MVRMFRGHPPGSFIPFKLPNMQMLFLNFVLEVSGERDAAALAHWVHNSCTISKVRTSPPEARGSFPGRSWHSETPPRTLQERHIEPRPSSAQIRWQRVSPPAGSSLGTGSGG